ncbi:hypothetical protein SAMN04488029_3184 [Reichenbachiella faecimaris]|uniref:Uncharacterized protein n=1 Tax=Reichenbachiella faecimaris TaxID=692418 RepID=A0A1W2GK24_REIFA|nr:hypothetical protein [Reichenbachiella faecimaris]SMD37000.1 hypothetical protein SAMN04488029_3184 [Reichenbachiella faecimaris]
MRYLNIIAILWILNSCSTPNSKTANDETPMDSVTVEQAILTEPTLESDMASEQEIEEELPVTFDSTGRPSRPVFKNVQVDTSELFGIWTVDPTGPHADFVLSKEGYYVVDSDGGGTVPFILDGKTLTLFNEEFKQDLEILSTKNDSLRTYIKEYDYEATYTRWKN